MKSCATDEQKFDARRTTVRMVVVGPWPPPFVLMMTRRTVSAAVSTSVATLEPLASACVYGVVVRLRLSSMKTSRLEPLELATETLLPFDGVFTQLTLIWMPEAGEKRNWARYFTGAPSTRTGRARRCSNTAPTPRPARDRRWRRGL